MQPQEAYILLVNKEQGTLTFKLPEFSNSKDITWSMDMDNGKLEELSYDMIIGRDLLLSLGMIIDFKYSVIHWGENNIPMNRTNLAKNDQKELNAIFQLATESKAAIRKPLVESPKFWMHTMKRLI